MDAHEAGHFMKLDDRYDKDTSEAKPGWEDNIMAKLDGSVSGKNIDEVLDDNRVREDDEEELEHE